MKTKKYILRIVMMALLGGTFASCESWFDIRPKSETVFEDFWKDENDVLSMVGSCSVSYTHLTLPTNSRV